MDNIGSINVNRTIYESASALGANKIPVFHFKDCYNNLATFTKPFAHGDFASPNIDVGIMLGFKPVYSAVSNGKAGGRLDVIPEARIEIFEVDPFIRTG